MEKSVQISHTRYNITWKNQYTFHTQDIISHGKISTISHTRYITWKNQYNFTHKIYHMEKSVQISHTRYNITWKNQYTFHTQNIQ